MQQCTDMLEMWKMRIPKFQIWGFPDMTGASIDPQKISAHHKYPDVSFGARYEHVSGENVMQPLQSNPVPQALL